LNNNFRKKVFENITKKNLTIKKPDVLWELDFFSLPKSSEDPLFFFYDNFRFLTFMIIVDAFSKRVVYVRNITEKQDITEFVKDLTEWFTVVDRRPNILHFDRVHYFTTQR
jgi:hypothetical protein